MAEPLHLQLRAAARDRAVAGAARRDLRRFARALALGAGELSVWLCGDASIQRLNRLHRGIDAPTDVLSFPAAPTPAAWPARPLGDLVVSLQTARRCAREAGRPLRDEVALYLAHGLLHLLGHDHHRPAEARRMAAEERRLLGAAGLLDEATRATRSASPARAAPARAASRPRGRGRRSS